MADRMQSPAYAALTPGARRVFAAIERAIGEGSSASVSYTSFRRDHGIGRRAVSPALKLLDHLGLIDIEPGPRLVNIFRLSTRWRAIGAADVVRLAALARVVRLQRRFENRREPKPVPSPAPQPIERPRVIRRRAPSLPALRCLQGEVG